MAPNMAPMINYTLPTMQLVCNLVWIETPAPDNTIPGPADDAITPELPVIPEGYVPHPSAGVAYKVHKVKVTWKNARTKCLADGAKLAVIDSFVKLEYLLTQASVTSTIHIGIHSMYDDKEWVSATTGLTVTAPPWATGYPKNLYDCGVAGLNPRGLRNLPCNTTAYYACELPLTIVK